MPRRKSWKRSTSTSPGGKAIPVARSSHHCQAARGRGAIRECVAPSAFFKEDAEKAAAEALTHASAAKAATDRATKLEADAQKQRDKRPSSGRSLSSTFQGSAIAKLFRLPDEEADSPPPPNNSALPSLWS